VRVRSAIKFTHALSQTRKLTPTHTHILRLSVSVPAPGCGYVCVHMYSRVSARVSECVGVCIDTCVGEEHQVNACACA